MFNIRRHMFETNSSSMHSIVVTKTDLATTLPYINNDGVCSIYLDSNEYGRTPFEVLSSIENKIKYVIASLHNTYEGGGKALIKYIEKLIKKHLTNVKKVEWHYWNNDYKYGDIDHQSQFLLNNFLTEKNITIEDFIFNGKYIIIIDGDEYQEFNELKDVGLINMDNIEEIFTNGGDW